jgi:hypothetical protein
MMFTAFWGIRTPAYERIVHLKCNPLDQLGQECILACVNESQLLLYTNESRLRVTFFGALSHSTVLVW